MFKFINRLFDSKLFCAIIAFFSFVGFGAAVSIENVGSAMTYALFYALFIYWTINAKKII